MITPDDEALLREVPWKHDISCEQNGMFLVCSCTPVPDFPAMARVMREAREAELKAERENNALLSPYIRAQATARLAAEARVKELEVSIIGHFQREHLEGDGPEIDRWKARVAALCEALESAHVGFSLVRGFVNTFLGEHACQHGTTCAGESFAEQARVIGILDKNLASVDAALAATRQGQG